MTSEPPTPPTKNPKTAIERVREEAARRDVRVREIAPRPGSGLVVFRPGSALCDRAGRGLVRRDVTRWLATFFATAIGAASVVVALWAIGLVLLAHEEIHWEWAIPGFLFAVVGGTVAVVLWRRGT